MTIQYEKMIVLLFNQLFMFRLQTAKILYDLLQEAKRFLLFFFIGDYHIQSMRNEFHFDVFTSHPRIAVLVHYPFFGAVYLYLFGTHGFNAAVLVNRFIE